MDKAVKSERREHERIKMPTSALPRDGAVATENGAQGEQLVGVSARRASMDEGEDDDLPLAKKAAVLANAPSVGSRGKKNAPPSPSSDKSSNPHTTATNNDPSAKPITSERKTRSSQKPSGKRSGKESDEESSDSDAPLASKAKRKSAGAPKQPAKKIKTESAEKKAKEEKATPVKRKNDAEKGDKSDEDTPLKTRRKRAKGGSEQSPPKTGKENGKVESSQKSKKTSERGDESEAEDDESDGELEWWKKENNDDSVKWTTLQHSGPVFPPPYVPHGVKMKYDGKEVSLEPDAEEVATFFAAILETDYASNQTFINNFFRDFLGVLKKQKKPCPIKEFSKCDFTPIHAHLMELKEQRKKMTKEEKQLLKEEKLKLEEKYGIAILDGRKEKVGNFRIEPPGLFRGRGNHPKTGTLKLRVKPEQVTINIGKDADIPKPPAGHKWADVTHDNTVTWLAMWKENVNDNIKYIFLAATSSLKGQSDLKKFEKARGLKQHVDRIRKDYTAGWKDREMAVRQRSTAMYLIDRFALRAGNEKGDDEADTVGCCSLRFEHITLEPPNKVIFDFLGKDSIRYYNEVLVDEQVFKNLKIFKREPKKEGDLLFDRMSTALLNKELGKYMEGLTAKVFRTFNASYTFQEELKRTPENATIQEKILAYNRANRQVAILCNHQRTVSKGHSAQMGKIQDKVLGLQYERLLVKRQLLELDPKLGKKMPELKEEEDGVDEAFIARYLEQQEQKEAEKQAKALEKENEKRAAEGLKALSELESPKKRTQSTPTVEKLTKKYSDLCKRIETTRLQMIDKDENKTTALSTSKINYIDPRISAAWCKKHGVEIDKIFNRSLREKFKWALEVDADWVF
ncbi:hypothetical protein DFJ73DRAFT_36747 [Zopfochytrium polystomum]|nr:hypothetical protein DFJ73DRAFT_36747 [Zopfochytrium polystomum]